MLQKQFSEMFTVYGGQFGSEGKGQIVRFIAGRLLESGNPSTIFAFRIGGPNAGHTFYIKDEKIVTCQIPGPMFLDPKVIGVIGPEGVISLAMLRKELVELERHNKNQPFYYQRLLIDRNAVIITDEEHDREAGLVKSIGSTGKGIGAATADKVLRDGSARIAERHPGLNDLAAEFGVTFNIQVVDTIAFVHGISSALPKSFAILEGTQGAGLSLHTSGHYPYCTSRECTPQGIWAGCGLHPDMASSSETIAVVRTYPIRVAGPSGPMAGETSWEEISTAIGREVKEITTVTKNVRRVATMDIPQLLRTIRYTRPDSIALTFADYIDPAIYKKDPNNSEICREYIRNLEKTLDTPVKYVGTGEGHVYDWLQ